MSMFGNIEQIAKTVTENTELQQLNLGTIIGQATAGDCSEIFKKMSGILKESMAEFPGAVNNAMDQFPDSDLLLNDLLNEGQTFQGKTDSTTVDPIPATTVGQSLDSTAAGKTMSTAGKAIGTVVGKALDNKTAIGTAIGKAIGTVAGKHHR